MEVLGGKATLQVAGIRLMVADSIEVRTGTAVRETQKGLSGVAGVTESDEEASVEGTAFAVKATDLAKLEKFTDETVNGSIGGRKFVINNAANMNPLVVDGTGKFSFRFEGKSGKWL